MNNLEARVSALEKWRLARWRGDDVYKKLPLIGERNLVEPTVVSVLKYFLKPGDTAFDVGSQAGHVVHALSHLVGPKGLVVAFEASTRTARKLAINIVDANLRNVELVHAAVCGVSGQNLKLYLHETQNNDSLFPSNLNSAGNFSPDRFVLVETIALDDYCEKWGVVPRLIKFDIEGAEYEALRGSERLIRNHKPVILIEDMGQNMRCFDYLTDLGYKCIDVIHLKPIDRIQRQQSTEANYLYIHTNEHLGAPFTQNLTPFQEIPAEQFTPTRQSGLVISPLVEIKQQSRFVVSWNFLKSEEHDSCAMKIGILDFKNELIARYQANLGLLKEQYFNIPFESNLDNAARIFCLHEDGVNRKVFESVSISVFQDQL